MILFEPEDLRALVTAVETAYPNEACGLLVGRGENGGRWRVARLAPSANLSAHPERGFEIDARLRLTLQRRLRGSGDRVIGLYHSHPDQSAQPSAADLGQAWEPDLVWVIVSVLTGEAVLTCGHVLSRHEDGLRFDEIAVHTTDWTADPVRSEPLGPGLP